MPDKQIPDRDSLREIYESVVEESGGQVSHVTDRYANLEAAGRGLRGYGGFLKVVGIVVAALGVLGGLLLGVKSDVGIGIGVLAAVAGAAGGVGLHAFGTVVAAAGEAMFAMRDTATYTRRAALALEAKGKRVSR